MNLIDANLLLYAYDTSSPFHAKARPWFEELLSSHQPVRFASVTLLAFLRIATNPRASTRPLPVGRAVKIVRSWLERPNVDVLHPGMTHFELLEKLAVNAQASGPLMMDAHLATLAIEHGALLLSTDRDFARFEGLRWDDPLRAP